MSWIVVYSGPEVVGGCEGWDVVFEGRGETTVDGEVDVDESVREGVKLE